MSVYQQVFEIIEKVCKEKYQGKQKRMADDLGISQSQLHKFLTKKSDLRFTSIAKILDKLNVQFTISTFSREVCFIKPKIINAEELNGPVDEDYLAVPLASMPVAAGQGIIPEESIRSWVLVWRHHESVQFRFNLVAVEIGKGQRSMEPTLHPGDIVLIDKGDYRPSPPPGNIYLVRFPGDDGGLAIKRVQTYSKDKKYLISFYSDNPQYPPEIYDLKVEYDNDISRAVIGRVVWAWSDMTKK
jgi:transcriptional regulator with XRE-family HTH domain